MWFVLLVNLMVLCFDVEMQARAISPDPNTAFHDELSATVTTGEQGALSKQNPPDNTVYSTTTTTTGIVPDELLSQFTPISHELTPNMNLASGELSRLITSAESGSPVSAYYMGLSHLYGLGELDVSPVKSVKYFRSSAIMGNTDAACALGLLLYYGTQNEGGTSGVNRDTKAALAWFKDTHMALWLYAKFDLFLDTLVDKFGWDWLQDDPEAWRKKYPKITKKIDELEARINELDKK